MNSHDNVILVDENDNEIGRANKVDAHRDGGKLHRAVSVFIFNANVECLLQRRASHKYHFPDKWSNACCTHPRPGETSLAAAQRRLHEEMGFSCDLEEVFSFSYVATCQTGLTEREFDHVFVGRYDGIVKPNPDEASASRWMNRRALTLELQQCPETFTPWFRNALPRVLKSWLEFAKIIDRQQ